MAYAMSIVSAVIGVVSAVSQSNAKQRQERFEQRVAQVNEQRAEENAARIRQAGAAAEAAKRIEIRRALGRSAAAMSQAGIGGPSYGSGGLAMKQASAMGEYDAQIVRYGYGSDANAQELEALNQANAAQAARRRARGAKTSGWINAASAVVNTNWSRPSYGT